MGHVGRFDGGSLGLGRGDTVVLRSGRGVSLGEVLAGADGAGPLAGLVERVAGPADLDDARRAEADQPRRLAAVEGVFGDGLWPIALLDVEPMLDGSTVLHYLGPHRLDAAGLVEALRHRCGIEAVLVAAGRDEPEAEPEGVGGCGEAGCGGGGGGCGTGSAGGGCEGCAVKEMVGKRAAVAGSGRTAGA